MQTVHSPFRIKNSHEISFSQFQNYNQRQQSRYQSPSIAVESIQQLIPSDLQEKSCMYSVHKKYLLRNEQRSWYSQQLIDESDECESKEKKASNYLNQLRNTNRQTLKQESNQKLYNAQKSFKNNVYETPVKQAELNSSQNENDLIYFSNTSIIKAQQNQAAALRSRTKRSIYSINFKHQNSQFQELSLSNYQLLSQRYLNASSTKNSHYSQDQIERQICKLQRQIQKLNKIKKQMNQVIKQDCEENNNKIIQKTLSQKENSVSKSKQVLSIQRQSQNLSLSCSKASDALVKSRIIKIKKQCNQEDVKIPKLLNKSASKLKKTQNKLHFQIYLDKGQLKKSQIAVKNAQSFKIDVNKKIKLRKESQQLIANLQQQIKLDDSLRKVKKWFKKWKSAQKWKQLASVIKSQNLIMKQSEMKSIFNLSSQEQNPFYTPKDQDCTLNKLICDYIVSQNHWSNYILGKYTSQGLKQGSFIEQNLDISKTGQICIQDIVRYINFQLDAVYRNRDLFLIFRRFSKGQQLYFEQIIRCLTQKQC